MSWNNCTQSEARDAFDYAKSKYKNASEEYLRNKQKLDKYQYEFSSAKSDYSSINSEKLDFEKRIAGIEDIIRMLSDGGLVNERIDAAFRSAQEFESIWGNFMACSGVNSPSVANAYKLPHVSENNYSADVLMRLRKEKQRLEQAIADLNKQMQQMEESLNAMIKQMNAVEATQSGLRKTMNLCSYEMTHYKKFF